MNHRIAVLWVALFASGCIVDVDLGQSGVETEPGPAADEGMVFIDMQPGLDTTIDIPILDAEPPDLAPLDMRGPDLAPPDLDGGLPDEGILLDCAFCIAVLTEDAQSCDPADECIVNPEFIAECGFVCGAQPSADPCESCFLDAMAIVGVCEQENAGGDPELPDACGALIDYLFSSCQFDCGFGDCELCLDEVLGELICVDAPPEVCSGELPERFAACADTCDPSSIGCAIDTSTEFALCEAMVGPQCIDTLFFGVDVCRQVAIDGWCLSAEPWLIAASTGCDTIGADPVLCDARDAVLPAVAEARCGDEPDPVCQAAAALHAAGCGAVGGLECDAVAGTIEASCRAMFGGAFDPCDACMVQGLAATPACADEFAGVDCLLDMEADWSRCLTECGRPAIEGDCTRCGIDADVEMAACLVTERDISTCLASREVAAVVCSAACGEARPLALPCDQRTTAVFEACIEAGRPNAVCEEGPYLFQLVCHWSRGDAP